MSRRARRSSQQPRTAATAPAGRARRSIVPLCAVALVIAACVAYATSFNGVFVFDDKYAILDNPHIKTLWPLTAAMSAPPENPVSGRPVASLTLAINYALADAAVRDAMLPGRPGDPPEATERFLANVWGYHALNLALHVLAGLALFGVVRRTLLSERLRPQFEDAATPLACAAALVWLVHPLTTDAVTYVCQRTEVLMGLFCLLTVYCSIRAAESPRRRAAWGAAAIAACALGMGSKQTMIVAPVLVWLWDWTFAAQPAGEASAGPRPPRWPLYAGLAATWSIVAASVALERWPHSIGLDRDGWTPWRYLLTQTGVITHYLRLVILPWPLALDYDGWPAAHGLGDVWAPALALAALFAVTVYGVLKRRPWSVATAAVFLLLAPSSSVLPLPTEIAAERRMYVPLAAIVALAVVAAFVVIRRLFVAVPRRRLALVVAVLVAGVVAGPLVFVTRARNRDFWSDSGIWGDTVAKRPDNPRARQSYGIALMRERRLPEAETELREAVRLRDTSAPAHGSLGVLLCMTGRTDDGIAHLERALALDPEYTDAFRNLGEAYASQGKREAAVRSFARAVDVSPDNAFLLSRLAWLLATSPESSVRDAGRAVTAGERAVMLTARHDVMALDTLAAAYAEAGRFNDAAATAGEAAALAARQGDSQTAADVGTRLALYRAGRPYREPSS